MGYRTTCSRVLICVHCISLEAFGEISALLTSMAKLPLLLAWARIPPQVFLAREKDLIPAQVGLPSDPQQRVHCHTQQFANCCTRDTPRCEAKLRHGVSEGTDSPAVHTHKKIVLLLLLGGWHSLELARAEI